MKKSLIVQVSVFALLLTSAVATTARAQDDDDAAAGITTSSGVKFTPTLSISEEYDDNVFTEENHENSDFITRIAPKLVIDASTKPDILQFNIGAEQVLYADETDVDYLNYGAGVKARHKFSDVTQWDGTAQIRHLHSLPGDDEANPANDSDEALPYTFYKANTSITQRISDLKITPRVGFVRYDYTDVRRNNGTIINQTVRDRNEYELGGRIGYTVDENIEPFVDLEYTPRDYDDVGVADRDSEGGEYLAGLHYKANKNLSGEVALGYMNRGYDAANLDDIDSLDASAMLNWNYAEDGKVKVTLNRTISEVTDTNVGGAVRTDVRAAITKGLMADLVGKIEGRYLKSDYQGGLGSSSGTSDREDRFFEVSAGATYTLNENVAFTADYSYGNNDSNRNTADYDRNVVMVGVKVGF